MMFTNYVLGIRKKNILRSIVAIGPIKNDEDFKKYIHSLKGLNKIKEKKMETFECGTCEGEGKVEDSTGLYPHKCMPCEGTGELKIYSGNPPPDCF